MRYLGWFITLAAGAFFTLVLSAFAQDDLFRTHMGLTTAVLGLAAIIVLRLKEPNPALAAVEGSAGYFDAPIRVGTHPHHVLGRASA